MSWQQPLDQYCERLVPEFWAEPINALTNISFIIAAVLAYRLGQKQQINALSFYWLVLVLAAIGIGSFLYHTFANRWSLLADLLPIYVFQLSVTIFYGAAIARFKQWPQWWGCLLILSGFLLLTYGASQLPQDWLNGSVKYIPAVIYIWLLGFYQYKYCVQERYTLVIAGIVFAISLSFRSIDMQLCDSIALGTHFLWHILNGVMLYLVIKAYGGILKEK